MRFPKYRAPSALLELLPATALSLLLAACGGNSTTSSDPTCEGESCGGEQGGAPSCASEDDCESEPGEEDPGDEDPDDVDPDDDDPDDNDPDDDPAGDGDADPGDEDPGDNDPDDDPDDEDPDCEGSDCDPDETMGVCGDGNQDDNEFCDAGEDNQDEWSSAPTCLTDCSALNPSCGDGLLEADFEVCDAGEENVADPWALAPSCGADCTFLPFCGDGILTDGFELCDAGQNNGIPTGENGEGCSATCEPLPYCGDGAVDEGEECDAGILSGKSDGCDASCHWVGLCDGLPTLSPDATAPSVERYPVEPNCVLPGPDPDAPSCTVPEVGAIYYVSAATGTDDESADGSLSKPWKTLRHGIERAKAPGTLRVAEGDYNSLDIAIIKPLVVKGGFSADFSSWDPEVHESRYFGRLYMNHNDAVWGGFLMRGAVPRDAITDNYYHSFHQLFGGSLIRNRVEIDYEVTTTTYYLYGIAAAPCTEGQVHLACNDVSVRGRTETGGLHNYSAANAITMGNIGLPRGAISLDGNHICQAGHNGSAVNGYGTCFPDTEVEINLSNNLIEIPGNRSSINFYGCGDSEMSVRLSNNTLLGRISGSESSEEGAAPLRWYMANNIVLGRGSGQCVDVVYDWPELSRIEQAYNNLCVGFSNNTISPAPILEDGNIDGSAYSLADIFVDPANGDYRILSDGPAAGSGRNLSTWSDGPHPLYDVSGDPRPTEGPWDLGAYNTSP
jgi:cysteine-rich repeat protein